MSRPQHLPAVLLALSALAAPAAAQEAPGAKVDTVRAGDPRLAALGLAAGVDTTDNWFVSPTGERRLGVLYVETITPTPGGFLVVERNLRPDGRQVSLDSIEVDARTFAPRWHADVTPRGSRRVVFAGGRVTGTAVDSAGNRTPVDAPVPAGAIDYSVQSLVLPRLPLRAGYRAVLQTYDVTRGPLSVGLRVLGEEELAPAGPRTWKVEIDFGTFQVTQWVDQKARRTVRTRVVRPGMELIAEPRPVAAERRGA